MIVWRRRSTGRARILHLLGAIAVLAGAGPLAHAQEPVDSSLLAYIATIRAIDVHAHPMRPVPPGAPADTEFDALPLDGIPPFAVPHRLSLDDPVWRSAQTALFHAPEAPSDSVYRASLRTRVESTVKTFPSARAFSAHDLCPEELCRSRRDWYRTMP